MAAFSHRSAFRQADHRQRRRTLILLAAMVGLLLACAWAIDGGPVALAALGMVGIGLGGINHLPARTIMSLHRAMPLTDPARPDLAATVAGLAARAGMKTGPTLYRLPGPNINALAAGCANHTAIALSDDSLSVLSGRELRAILAHEVSHLAAGDSRLLATTCLITHLTQGTAQIALLGGLVVVMVSGTPALSVVQVLTFTIAVPMISLLQLALSRNQEFAADLGAIRLTDDPIGLIAALERIETQEDRMVRSPGAWSHLLCSHPTPRQRISRLLARIYRAPPDQPPVTEPVLNLPAALHLPALFDPLGPADHHASRRVHNGLPSSDGRPRGTPTLPTRLRRSGGLTMPPDITTLSPSSTVISNTITSLRGTNNR